MDDEVDGEAGRRAGRHHYPQAARLLITADSAGSNGSRLRLWKTELATLAAQAGLEITVAHFPPGTSRWNKVEHRLSSFITMNWRARPLISHQVVIETIAATTTKTGLTVRAMLDTSTYEKGIKISDKEMQAWEARHLMGIWQATATRHGRSELSVQIAGPAWAGFMPSSSLMPRLPRRLELHRDGRNRDRPGVITTPPGRQSLILRVP